MNSTSLRLIAFLILAAQVDGASATSGRLVIPHATASQRAAPGLQRLEERFRGGEIYIPHAAPNERTPLLILLHGSERTAADWFPDFGKYAEKGAFVIIAPEASGKTWGGGMHDFGPDVTVINRAIAVAATKCALDPERVAIGGFSDGASYAMSLGLANGDVIRHVVAFSPGYFNGHEQRGKPAFFISAGVNDPILPVDQCSRRFVATLRKAGYPVEYKEFYGRHEIPSGTCDAAMNWLMQAWRAAR